MEQSYLVLGQFLCFESADPESFRDDQRSPDSKGRDAYDLRFTLTTKLSEKGLFHQLNQYAQHKLLQRFY